MEITLLTAGIVTVLVIAFTVRQVVRGCARTVFAAPPEPSAEEIARSQTPCTLPDAVPLSAQCPVDAQQLTQQAEQVLIAWMQAVNDRDEAKIQAVAPPLAPLLQEEIARQKGRGERERLERPSVYGAVVSGWDADAVTVTLAAQAVHYTACGGQLTRGREDLPEQMLWEVRGTIDTAGSWTADTICRLTEKGEIQAK